MKTTSRRAGRALLLVGSLLLAAVQSAMANEADKRVNITTQGPASAFVSGTLIPSSRDEFDALQVDGKRNEKPREAAQQKASMNSASGLNTDFWFYDAWVVLYSDIDRDGYYTGIELTFDADTIYSAADVFAVVYLSLEYGPWNEYAETEVFTITGSSALDEYTIETDLVAGYPTGDYDILIELYDAYDGYLVASIGPEETSELAILPLEDMSYDSPHGDTTQIVVNSGGGGSASLMLLLALAGAAWLARERATSLRQTQG